MAGKHKCEPKVFTQEGGDHTGVDAFMKCAGCGKRTTNHVECHTVTANVRQILLREWKSGRALLAGDQPLAVSPEVGT